MKHPPKKDRSLGQAHKLDCSRTDFLSCLEIVLFGFSSSVKSSLFPCVCQRLLAGWPPAELLSDLENWLKKLEARLSQDQETLLKAKDAAQISEVLQHYKVQAPTTDNLLQRLFSSVSLQLRHFYLFQ